MLICRFDTSNIFIATNTVGSISNHQFYQFVFLEQISKTYILKNNQFNCINCECKIILPINI